MYSNRFLPELSTQARARPIEKKTQNIKIKCLIFQKSIIWPKPIQNQYKPIQLTFVKHAPFCQNRPFWLCHQYLHEFSYDYEQEIFCFFLWWWTRKSDIDKFQFLMAEKLHSWQRVWSSQELSQHHYRQEIFCFFLWWRTRKSDIVNLLWRLSIEYMFGKRDIAWPI